MNSSSEVGKSPRNRGRDMAYDSVQGRPEPDFVLDPFHRALRAISVAAAVFLPAAFLIWAIDLDQPLPMQYSFSGEVSREGSPTEAVMGLGLLGSVTVGIAVLTRYPQAFNFPFGISGDTVQLQYRNAVQMLIWMAAGMALIMVAMFGNWLGFLPIGVVAAPLAVLGISLVFFFTRMARIR